MDLYSHIKVLFSILLGLGVSHILRGLARIVQHPKQYRVYWVHLVWSLFLFLYLIHFWWWEFRLRQVAWTFPVYFFIALYATLIYVLCTLLFSRTRCPTTKGSGNISTRERVGFLAFWPCCSWLISETRW
jgi:hypothetical protein